MTEEKRRPGIRFVNSRFSIAFSVAALVVNIYLWPDPVCSFLAGILVMTLVENAFNVYANLRDFGRAGFLDREEAIHD